MFASLVPLCLAAALGQAPGDSAWLKAVPADVAVVARVRSLNSSRDDLLKMLEAMSPNASALAKPQIEQGLTIFSGMYGKAAVEQPLMAILRLPKDGPMPAWAVMT